MGEAIGISVKNGSEEETQGVDGKQTKLYLHRVSIHMLNGIETITAGFSFELPLVALLGRRGFLDRFRFTYDPSTHPPQFDVSKIARA